MLPAGVKEIMASPASLFSAYASFTASMMLVRTMVNDTIPRPVQSYLWLALSRLFHSKRPAEQLLTLVVEEYGANMTRNEIFEAAELYLSSKIGTDTERLKISKCSSKNQVLVRLARDETILDTFDAVELKWKFVTITTHKSSSPTSDDGGGSQKKKRHFELSFDKKHKDKIIESYVPFLIEKSINLKDKEKVLKMFTLGGYGRVRSKYGSGAWGAVDLEHPSTFDTLAMEPELKKAIMSDLDRSINVLWWAGLVVHIYSPLKFLRKYILKEEKHRMKRGADLHNGGRSQAESELESASVMGLSEICDTEKFVNRYYLF